MPKLRDDASARLVDCTHNGFPAGHLPRVSGAMMMRLGAWMAPRVIGSNKLDTKRLLQLRNFQTS